MAYQEYNLCYEQKTVNLRSCPSYFIEGGQIHPVQHHPAVPLGDVIWLAGCMEDGHAFVHSIKMLRCKHFPVNYNPHPWVPGKIQLLNINCFISKLLYLYI